MTTETKMNASEALSRAHTTLASQIGMIMDMPPNSAKTAIGAFGTLLQANVQMVLECINSDIDDYDKLCDMAEKLDEELLQSQAKRNELLSQIASLKSEQEAEKAALLGQLEEAERAVQDAQNAAAKAEQQRIAANLAQRNAERELKQLKELDPVGLKNKLKAKNVRVDELVSETVALKNDVSHYRHQINQLNSRLTSALAAIDEQDAELLRRQEIINEQATYKHFELLWGEHLRKDYRDDSGALWWVYLLAQGANTNSQEFINDLPWKLHLMRADGSGCSIMISQWLIPILPAVPAADIAPMDAIKDMHHFIIDALQYSHPHLLARAEWAQELPISELGLTPKLTEALIAGGISNMWEAARRQPSALMQIKGVGHKGAEQIRNACTVKAAAWLAQYQQQQEAA